MSPPDKESRTEREEPGLAIAAGFFRALERAEELGLTRQREVTRVLVSLSGGPDSTSLLLALHSVAQAGTLELSACHVNHALRGAESDADEQFCAQLCQSRSIPFFARRLSEPANVSRLPAESDLRDNRYEQLTAVARENIISIIVTGHTLNDQIETVLFRFFRGSSLPGLIGMQPARLIAIDLAVLRPMLTIDRAKCLQFLSEQAIEARNDKSNEDIRYTRNFIRRQVVPVIESRFPGFSARIDNFRTIAADENELLEVLGRWEFEKLEPVGLQPDTGDITWDVDHFDAMHPALQRRVIVMALERRHVEVSFERVETILDLARQSASGCDRVLRFSLDAVWDIRIDEDRLDWLNKTVSPPRTFGTITVKVPGTTVIAAIGKALRVESYGESAEAGSYPKADALTAVVDLSQVGLPLILRQRQPGDLIQPFGMGELVRLKKYLHTHKPHKNMLEDLLLANEKEVLWVPGVGLSDKLKVCRRPTHRLSLVDLAPDQPHQSVLA